MGGAWGRRCAGRGLHGLFHGRVGDGRLVRGASDEANAKQNGGRGDLAELHWVGSLPFSRQNNVEFSVQSAHPLLRQRRHHEQRPDTVFEPRPRVVHAIAMVGRLPCPQQIVLANLPTGFPIGTRRRG